MIPSEPPPGQATANGAAGGPPVVKATLRPPEWAAPPTLDVAEGRSCAGTLERLHGARAEEAWLRARVSEARAREDVTAARDAEVELARWLSARDRELDEAVRLAEKALEIVEDGDLRREVSTWLEGLGEPAHAAVVLHPIAAMPDVEPEEAAYVLVRAGVLRARGGALAAAAASFELAASVDPDDALSLEMLGALAAASPEIVPPGRAAEAYVEAAWRRAAAGASDSLENLLRAFAIDPSSRVAARA
jgi:hypothetical protein